MSRVTRLLVLASVLAFARGQNAAAGLDPCAQGCVNSVLANGAALGCKAGESNCLCAKPDFTFGVRDCAAAACPATIAAQATNFVQTFCATATLATSVTTPDPAAAGAAGASTSTSSLDRPTPSSAPQSAVTNSTTAASTTASTTTTSSQSSTQSTSSASATTSANAGGGSATASTDGEDDDKVGLSVGAKAGIGITVAILGTGLIGLVFWLLRRSRNRSSINTGDFHISGPMPGSGRDYADSHLDFKENNNSELELRSRRYEDMLPRQQPASMI